MLAKHDRSRAAAQAGPSRLPRGAAAALLLLSACTYLPAGQGSYGFPGTLAIVQVRDTYRVQAETTGRTTAEALKNAVSFRASELMLEQGHRYYTANGPTTRPRVTTSVQPGWGAFFGAPTLGATTTTETSDDVAFATLFVHPLTDKEATAERTRGVAVLDAHAIYDSLGPSVRGSAFRPR